MQAIQVHSFGDPEVMELRDLPNLEPQSGQVLVQLQAAGVNPVDTYIRSGLYARQPDLPYTPGLDGAGTIAAVGQGVTGVKVGDRIYGGWPLTGTYASYALYDAHQVYELPSNLSFTEGAGIFVPYATAYRALFYKANAQPGDWVLIHGATGSVGLAAVQLAVAAGCRVIGTGGTPQGRELVEAQGAQQVFDHHDAATPQALLDITQGRGVDVIIEMLANVNLGQDLTLLYPGGRVVVVGSRGPVEINPRDLMGREAVVTGFTLFNTPTDEMARIQAALGAGLRQGTLKPVVNRTFPLEQAPLAHQQVMAPGARGNLLLLP